MIDYELLPDERLDKVNEDITLIQKKDGLTFGTDAFLLASFIKEQKSAKAVELGAGTGIISLLCAARNKLATIEALEIQEDFFDITTKNIKLNGFEDKVKARICDIRDISARTLGYEADVVFSNPPYMSTDTGKRNSSDRKYIARHEVCGNIGDFCSAAYRILKHGGKFYCVWRPDRLSSLMSALIDNRLEPKRMVFVHSDSISEASMVLVSATKCGAEGMHLLPPLLLYNDEINEKGTRSMTKRTQKIYDTMNFSE